MTTSSSAFAETADLTESLVQRIGAGDTAAENELVAHFRRGLFFVLRRECGDSELAQDITQDTLEKVIRNARDGKIQKPRALTQYIRHVGVYQLIDYRRKEKRRKTDPSADIADQTPTADQSLLEQVDGQQIAELVRALLEEMTVERDKEVLRRFYLIGQDKATIAAEFDITLDHFDRVKSRALLRLRKLATENLKARGPDQKRRSWDAARRRLGISGRRKRPESPKRGERRRSVGPLYRGVAGRFRPRCVG